MQKLVYDGSQSCPYLPGRVARMPLYRQLRRLTLAEADARFANAERRVGACLYATACATCNACEGLRIPVADFKPNKSQRRTLNRWAREGGRVEYGAPTFSAEKLALFNRHKLERGLNTDDDLMSEAGYVGWLVNSCFQTMEMRYYLDDRLIGVGIADLGQTSLSSVYFYFDPDASKSNPGTLSVLHEIEFARKTGRTWLYLGLYVADCSHLNYKAKYKPHERLFDGDWRLIDRESP